MSATQVTIPGAGKGITADQIRQVIREHFAPRHDWERPNWLILEEVRCGAGFERAKRERPGVERRLDVLLVHTAPSKNHDRWALEIKASRSDFLKELKTPTKRRMALMFSNRFYFVTPPGLVQSSELPPECGLIEVDPFKDRRERWNVKVIAPERDCQPPTWSLLVSIVRAEQTKRVEAESLAAAFKSRWEEAERPMNGEGADLLP